MKTEWKAIFAKEPRSQIENGLWKTIGSLLIFDKRKSVQRKVNASKLACFDLDGTLWKSKIPGRVFQKDENDWMFWSEKVPTLLNSLSPEHFVFIFTNQQGMLESDIKRRQFQIRVQNFSNQLNRDFVLLAGCDYDIHRKPCIGMWNFALENYIEEPEKILRKECFFVGDAAGRLKESGKKADHSDSDWKFALNAGIQFFTPEEYFLSSREERRKVLSGWDPNLCSLVGEEEAKDIIESASKPFASLEVVMMVGFPASGKTSFYEAHLKRQGYLHVNRDTLGNREKCIALLKKSIREDQISCCIDETSLDIDTRKLYLDICQELNVPVRCLYFSHEECFSHHLNAYRCITKRVPKIPSIAYRAMAKKFKPPHLDEGFSQIVQVPFVPSFKDEKERSIFYSFLWK